MKNGKKQEYCGFVFLERKIILTIFFTGKSIRNGRFITKGKHGMQGRHKLRCKALKNNMAKDRCKTMSLATLVIMFLSTKLQH